MESTFGETQKFNKWWHYLIAGVPCLLIIVLASLVQFDIVPSKDGSKESELFIALIVFTSLIFFWFLVLKLKTFINREGIFITFAGIPFSKRIIKWEEIQSIAVVTYSPLTDYGGWGVRYSASGNGWCYNVSGKNGIKLIRTNGKPFLIGTQQPGEAEKIINLYFKK
ncbi:MAG: hypothetical protein V4580_04230 [Bacteroidota bacterium]